MHQSFYIYIYLYLYLYIGYENNLYINCNNCPGDVFDVCMLKCVGKSVKGSKEVPECGTDRQQFDWMMKEICVVSSCLSWLDVK